jgi:hypothetical protein
MRNGSTGDGVRGREARVGDWRLKIGDFRSLGPRSFSTQLQVLLDAEAGVLFFQIDISLPLRACSGGGRNSPSLISPRWREPSAERGCSALFT